MEPPARGWWRVRGIPRRGSVRDVRTAAGCWTGEDSFRVAVRHSVCSLAGGRDRWQALESRQCRCEIGGADGRAVRAERYRPRIARGRRVQRVASAQRIVLPLRCAIAAIHPLPHVLGVTGGTEFLAPAHPGNEPYPDGGVRCSIKGVAYDCLLALQRPCAPDIQL